MRAVHYGAGNIGRGFIGLMLSRSGYEVTFIDVNDGTVHALQQRGEYLVTLANEQQDTEWVKRVTAIHGNHQDEVAEEVSGADLVTTAIGVSALPYIAQSLAEGIRRRLELDAPPLHIIACENTIGGSSQLQSYVYSYLTKDEQLKALGRIVFPNAAVDRIVPIQHHEDPLQVEVEPFYEWVVDRSVMLQGYPTITGVHYVDVLEPYISRKLFTVNTGHCCAAYYGYLHGHETIQQVMADEKLREKVYRTLNETGDMLCRRYGFDNIEHEAYVVTILDRFANPYLSDDVLRVGRSPIRKLSVNDRLVRPALLAHDLGMSIPYLTEAIVAALRFDYDGDPEAIELQNALYEQGIHDVIRYYLGIASEHPLHAQIVQLYEENGGVGS